MCKSRGKPGCKHQAGYPAVCRAVALPTGFRDSPELRWDLQTDDSRTLMSGHDHKCIYIYIHKINSLKVLDGMGSIKFQGIHGLHYFQGPDAAVENLVVQS